MVLELGKENKRCGFNDDNTVTISEGDGRSSMVSSCAGDVSSCLPVLEVVGISKNYGEIKALDSLSFKLGAGKILGMLGENGAGKSTTISILTCDIKPDEGKVLFQGKEISGCKNEYLASLGYVPQEIALFEDLSVIDNLKFWANAYKVGKNKIETRLKVVSESLSLTEILNRKPARLSGGYKRRVNIACALLHEPKILLLDEPTVGIDLSVRLEILDVVKKLAAGGMSVIYTTHYLDELEKISDFVLIIKEGQKIAFLSHEQFAEKTLEDIYLSLLNEN